MDEKVTVQRKIGRFMTVAMGITVSIVLSAFGVISSGHFSVPMLLLSMVISIVLALIIGFLLPVQPVKMALTKNIKNNFLRMLVGNVITNLFYVLIITTVLVFVMNGMAAHIMDMNNVPASVPRPNALKVLPSRLLESYIVSFVVTFLLEPLYLMIAKKKYLPAQMQ